MFLVVNVSWSDNNERGILKECRLAELVQNVSYSSEWQRDDSNNEIMRNVACFMKKIDISPNPFLQNGENVISTIEPVQTHIDNIKECVSSFVTYVDAEESNAQNHIVLRRLTT